MTTGVKRIVRHMPGMVGCSDGNCILQDNSNGMHTNGGCRCEKELMRTTNGLAVARTIRWLQGRTYKIEGARDMLREAAKQFRATGDDAHAAMCDNHADELERA